MVKNISTDGEVISKIKVAYLFLGHVQQRLGRCQLYLHYWLQYT